MIISTLFFLAAVMLLFPAIDKHYDNENGMRNVVINRIEIDAQKAADTGDACIADLDAYRKEYDDRAVPDRVEYIDTEEVTAQDEAAIRDAFGSEFICPIKGTDGTLKGFLKITYLSGDKKFTLLTVGVILMFSYIVLILTVILLYCLMVKPFNTLSEYPEKIAKGRLTEGIPQSRSGLFGKYIWGMNMLKDDLSV